MNMVICKEIRRVEGGYIAELRWPYGGEVIGCGERIFTSFDELLEVLRRAACEEER